MNALRIKGSEGSQRDGSVLGTPGTYHREQYRPPEDDNASTVGVAILEKLKDKVFAQDDTKVEYTDTFHSVKCLKLSVQADGRTSTGTLTCNNCAKVPSLQTFVSKIAAAADAARQHTDKFTPNKHLSREQVLTKLTQVTKDCKNLRKKVSRTLVRKRTAAAQEALVRNDVKKFTKELQFIAQRGTLTDKQVMWSYLKDVVHAEFLSKKQGVARSRGMRWSKNTLDFTASQKLMAGKRLPEHLKDNIGGPSRTTILRHVGRVRTAVQPGPSGCRANFDAIAAIWKPLINKRRALYPNLGVIMVELSEDESGITPLIEYWREKDSILGSCCFVCDEHKCNDHFHPTIGDSWDRLAEIMRRSVASTYLRVIMCNPLNDWLPPMVCFVSATCNKFDHVPHVTSQWDITLAEFNRVLRPLGCNHTGRGSDGDGRRTKLQHELANKAAQKLNALTAAALVLQHRWRRPTNVVYVVYQLLRRRVTGTVLVRISLTFTMPISLSANGFTFVAMATYDTQSGAMWQSGRSFSTIR